MRSPRLRTYVVAAGLIAATAFAVWMERRQPDRAPLLASATAPTVVFVVLDTVRADHTSLCGYGRPTTPTLEALAEKGACTCQAVSPGAWTLPSHASYFTGAPVLEHEADFAQAGGVQAAWDQSVSIRPLDGRLPTLAERFRDKGYQTVALSANPVLAPDSGLQRGFEHFEACKTKCRGSRLNERARRFFDRRLDRHRPLFLFANYMDAHSEWGPIPNAVAWVPPTRALAPNELVAEFLRGELAPDQARAFLQRRTDLYDWGVHRADESLGQLLAALEMRGWFSDGYRLVVTSDHGELLGEHGLLDHGVSLHEENNRVPLCVVDTARVPPPFASRVSGLVVHDLLLGEPPGGHTIDSVAFPRTDLAERTPAGVELWTAHWEGSAKTVMHGEVVETYDLDADAGEAAPTTPPPENEGRRHVVAEAQRASRLFAREGATSEKLLEILRAVGYVE